MVNVYWGFSFIHALQCPVNQFNSSKLSGVLFPEALLAAII